METTNDQQKSCENTEHYLITIKSLGPGGSEDPENQTFPNQMIITPPENKL